jgi:hypothetical protein
MKTRQEYNKEYYKNKKTEICEKLFVKVECDRCGRTVTHQNLPKHQKTNYCKLRQARAKPKQDILSELEIIKLELRELKKSKDTTDPLVMCWGCSDSFKESEKSEHKCKKKPRPICKLKE